MERIPLGNGRFLIQMSPEEIARLNKCTEMAIRAGVNCVSVLEKQKREGQLSPEELHNITKVATELAVKAANIISNKP